MLARPAALILRVGCLTATPAVPLILAHLALAAAPIRARAAALIFHFFFGAGVEGDAGVDMGAGITAVPGCAKTLVISLIWASMAARSLQQRFTENEELLDVRLYEGEEVRKRAVIQADFALSKAFRVIPCRWVVERTFGWLGRYRRLSRDYERQATTGEALIFLAMIRLMLNRLAEL